MTDQSPTTVTEGSRNERFIAFVRRIAAADAGDRARLRRALRDSAAITDDAWWLLGAWLPTDRAEALVMTHVAAWCAEHHRVDPVPWRTLAGEIAAAGKQVSRDVARRSIEGITAEGAALAVRLDRANRIIEQLRATPVRIDWARLISDLVAFDRGGERAHAARHRWYRDYFNITTDDQDNKEPTE